MAYLLTPTNVRTSGNGWYMQYNIYTFYTTSAGIPYIHFKTNVSASTEKIFMIEAIGYDYGNGDAIRCAWGLYTTGGSVVSKGLQSFGYTSADGVYVSGDGYACIRLYSSQNYFTGFVLNAHTNANFSANIAISAVSNNNTSGNYY